MGRLIDTDELIANVAPIVDLRTLSTKTIGEAIAKTPTVDAVPVVRCKDCRWRKDNSVATAWMPCRALVTPDDFSCVVGERKDGGDNG